MEKYKFIKEIKAHIEMSLMDLIDCTDKFNIGQKYAYIDTLEMIQSILGEKERNETGLDYYIEDKYPLE